MLLLKDVLRWADFRKDVKETSNLKQLAPTKQGACVKLKTLEPPPPMTYGGSSFRRLQRLQVAKEQQKQLKLKELVLWLNAQVDVNMVVSTLIKTVIIEDQNIMALFTLLNSKLFSKDTKEYIMLQKIR